MEQAIEHRVTHDHRVLNRAPGPALQVGRKLVGRITVHLVPPGPHWS
jgi:hypothetical protein